MNNAEVPDTSMQRTAHRAAALASALVGAMAIAGCGIGAPRYHPGHAASRAEVLVRPFRVDAPAGDHAGSTDYGRLFAENLAGALQERGVQALLDAPGSGMPLDAAYVVEGAITELDPGSRSLRVWIGFGAGRAAVGARVRVVSSADDRTVFEQTLDVHSATWQGEDDILRRCVADLARQVADRLVRELRPATSRGAS